MPDGRKVELRPAHMWTCPECGRRNFEAPIVAEMLPEEMDQFRKEVAEQGADREWLMGQRWMTAPEEVVCGSCANVFEVDTSMFGDGEE